MADGGEGSLAVIHRAVGGELRYRKVLGTLQEPIMAPYLIKGWTAYIELARVSGMDRVLKIGAKLNPMLATTYGTGQLIRKLVQDEPKLKELYLCVGGSATVDGGIGVLQGMGFKVLDDRNRSLPLGSRAVTRSKDVREDEELLEQYRSIKAKVVCDVTNPLVGPNGAARVYGPQKGLKGQPLVQVENGLEQWGKALNDRSGKPITKMKYGGASGGVPAALSAICGWELVDGFDTIAGIVKLEKMMDRSTAILTGEGRTDAQSPGHKVVFRVRDMAKPKPTHLLAGSIDGQVKGFATSYAIMRTTGVDKVRAMAYPRRYLRQTFRKMLADSAL